MSEWRGEDEERDQWPVRYPSEAPPRRSGRRFRDGTSPRWVGKEQTGSSVVKRRLLWLLLAAEIGMVVAAACVLPLAFVNLPVREEGVVGAILSEVGRWLGLSSQAVCLVLALPIPILLLALSANLWLYRWLRQRSRG
jgi:hypothetical protein